MKAAVPVVACAIALAWGLSAGIASAATTSKKAKATASSKSTKAAPAKSTKASKGSKGKSSKPTAKARPTAAPLPELSQAQLDVAQRVQIGRAQCEFDQTVDVLPDATRFGAFQVRFKNKTYKMVPEETATGAVRLQDADAGVVWLQIPVKSMMMNMNVGQRMVDACTQPKQRVEQADADARARAAEAARLAAPAASTASGADGSAPQVAQPGQGLPLLRN